MKAEKDRKKILSKMQAITSRSEKCSHDISQKLQEYSISDEDREWVLKELKRDDFIDDRRYAEHFTTEKFRINRWGKKKIYYSLKHKNINEDIIAGALSGIIKEEYQDSLYDMLKKKVVSLREDNLYKRKGRLFQFASQRGFEADLIHQAIERLTGGEED